MLINLFNAGKLHNHEIIYHEESLNKMTAQTNSWQFIVNFFLKETFAECIVPPQKSNDFISLLKKLMLLIKNIIKSEAKCFF